MRAKLAHGLMHFATLRVDRWQPCFADPFTQWRPDLGDRKAGRQRQRNDREHYCRDHERAGKNL